MLIYLLGLLCLFLNSFANNKQTLITLSGSLTSLSNNALKLYPIHGHGHKRPSKRPHKPGKPVRPVKPTAPLITLKLIKESSAKSHPYTEYQLGGCKIRLVIQDILQEPADAIVNAANTTCLGGGGIDGAISAAGGSGKTGVAADGREQHTTLYDLRYALPHPTGDRCPEKEGRITRGGWLNYNFNDPLVGNHKPRSQYKYVIHAAGPSCGDEITSLEKEAVASTYTNVLERVQAFNIEPKDRFYIEFKLINTSDLGTNYQIRNLSFPTISTGIYGCKTVDTVNSVVKAILAYLKGEKDLTIKQINFVFWDPTNPQKGQDDYDLYKKTFAQYVNK